jgi:aminobenzoyl-glutamate utilization protein A
LDLEIIEGGCLGGSEDITYMLRTVENNGGHALYLLFGTNLVSPHHNPRFDFDETVLLQGYNCYTKIVTDLLKN